MKNKLLLILFVFVTIINAQNKVTDITDYDYCQVNSNSLYFYKIEKKGFTQSRGHFNGNRLTIYATEKVDTIKKKHYDSMDEIKLADLNSDFDLSKEFKDKVYFVNQSNWKYFYYLKSDSVLFLRKLKKNNVWQVENEKEDEIHKIVMANNKIIYWSSQLGLIYKKNNEIKTSFPGLQSCYNDKSASFSVKDKNAVNMETGYFEIGKYALKKIIKDNNFTVFKDNQKVLDDFPLKYYNNKQFISIDDKSVKLYNSDFKLDSTFIYRDINHVEGSIEILTENKIKKIDTGAFIPTFSSYRSFGCGTVTRYSLSIKRNRIREIVDAGMTYGYTSQPKNIFIDSKVKFDSLLFISRKKNMDHSVNGGFDDRLILIKNKKEGLYTFKQKNDTITLTEVVPIKYDKIYLLNGFVILNKKDQFDIYDECFKQNNMRFTNIDFFSYNYVRYRKRNHTEGWMNSKGTLFDDL